MGGEMTQRIVLLLGFLVIFTSPVLVQEKEKTPAPAKFKAKTIQWTTHNGGLAIESEAGEKYILHLGLPFPAMEKMSAGNERRLLLFPYAYEAVLQQRFIAMLLHKIAFSTNKYDRGQDQGEKKEDRPKRLEMFFWDASRDNLSAEITPGVFKNGAIFPLNEKLKYSFDLKGDTIFLENLPSRRLDDDDTEMIKNFLAFLAVYVRESVEWYEVEMSKERKVPLPPEKKKNDIANNLFAGSFYTHPRISGVFFYGAKIRAGPGLELVNEKGIAYSISWFIQIIPVPFLQKKAKVVEWLSNLLLPETIT